MWTLLFESVSSFVLLLSYVSSYEPGIGQLVDILYILEDMSTVWLLVCSCWCTCSLRGQHWSVLQLTTNKHYVIKWLLTINHYHIVWCCIPLFSEPPYTATEHGITWDCLAWNAHSSLECNTTGMMWQYGHSHVYWSNIHLVTFPYGALLILSHLLHW